MSTTPAQSEAPLPLRQAVLYIYLSWDDARAAPAVANASASGVQTCARPCSTLAVWQPGVPCCDALWLPHLEFTNVQGFNQDRVMRYGIRLDEGSGAVGWWAHVHGQFYTPMSFAAFPFDRQILLVGEREGMAPALGAECAAQADSLCGWCSAEDASLPLLGAGASRLCKHLSGHQCDLHPLSHRARALPAPDGRGAAGLERGRHRGSALPFRLQPARSVRCKCVCCP